MQLAEERFRALFQDAPYALVVFDTAGTIALANAQSERMFGYPRAELIGRPVEALVPTRLGMGTPWYRGREVSAEPDSAVSRLPGGDAEPTQLELRARRADGHEFPIEVSLTPLDTEQETLFSAAFRDVTEIKEAAAALAHRANHDSLTGLPNRALFVDRLEQALRRARRSADWLAWCSSTSTTSRSSTTPLATRPAISCWSR